MCAFDEKSLEGGNSRFSCMRDEMLSAGLDAAAVVFLTFAFAKAGFLAVTALGFALGDAGAFFLAGILSPYVNKQNFVLRLK